MRMHAACAIAGRHDCGGVPVPGRRGVRSAAAMSSTRAQGERAETLACGFLERHGLRLLARNYRCARGELDLIMRDGSTLVFVEVRYRKGHRYGSAAESVDARKRGRLTATASHYLQSNPRAALAPARFDVVCVTPGAGGEHVEWIRDAFGP